MNERGAKSSATRGGVQSLPVRAFACLLLWAILGTAFASGLATQEPAAPADEPTHGAAATGNASHASHGRSLGECGSACIASCASGGASGPAQAATVTARRARIEIAAPDREARADGPSPGVPLRPPRGV